MSSAHDPLTRFIFTPGLDWWEAELPVPLWGGQLPVQIAASATGPSARQVETLRAILGYPRDLRGTVGEALLALYRDEWGGVTPSLGQAPELRSADEVWAAMSQFALYIPAFKSAAGGVVLGTSTCWRNMTRRQIAGACWRRCPPPAAAWRRPP